MRDVVKNSFTVLTSLAVSFVLCEVAFRAYAGVPIFAYTNFRTAQVIHEQLSGALDYDPQLGWKLKPFLTGGGDNSVQVHTIEFGVRRNRPGDDHIRVGGILVVGASFTAGSEVRDDQAWPAQLEELIGTAVVNAAEGGYSADQILLRAEEMLPVVKPKVLIIDLVSDNIEGAGYSYDGYPKPYFTVSNGELAEHNVPVPRYIPPGKTEPYLRDFVGHSLLVHRFMATFFRDFWFSSSAAKFLRADNDPVDITCRLIQRVKKETDAAGGRLLLTVQYGGGYMMAADRPSTDVALVERCAARLGIQVADEYERLAAELHANVENFKKNYMIEENGVLGHKSPYGNLEVARMVQAALAEPAPNMPVDLPIGEPASAPEKETFSHKNLLSPAVVSQLAGPSQIAKVTVARIDSDSVYRIDAEGGTSEHYVAIGNIAVGGGPLTLSMDVRKEHAAAAVRIQLLDKDSNGVAGDFDLNTGAKSSSRLGWGAEIGAGAQQLDGGWRRVWVTVDLPRQDKQMTILIQLADDDSDLAFPSGGEALSVRRIKLEQGRLPSPYDAPADH